ncbi:flagellar filament outer layer protein [Spirochaetia bacterium]|nr:flagellar filament outer layer protein [Spirochaetia bacterium]
MKRMFILVAIVSLVAGSLFAEEAVLIDFSKLAADISVNDQPENRQTLMDFSDKAGGSFTAEQRAMLRTSLAPANWVVSLASSARTVENQRNSKAQESTSKQYGSVLGVRIHFPVEPHNSWASIKPPFEIPAYELSTVDEAGEVTLPPEEERLYTNVSRFEGTKEEGDSALQTAFGVVKNVGTIKSVAVNVYGLNFPHRLAAILIDSEGNEKIIDLGYLNHDGWGEHVWNNPAYVQEVRSRELRLYPLYPILTPFVKFGGFLIQRDAATVGGDFVVYFKDVKIVYDKAVRELESDIDDEKEWSIIQARDAGKDKAGLQRFGQNQVLQYVDKQKQATEPFFDDPSRRNNNE